MAVWDNIISRISDIKTPIEMPGIQLIKRDKSENLRKVTLRSSPDTLCIALFLGKVAFPIKKPIIVQEVLWAGTGVNPLRISVAEPLSKTCIMFIVAVLIDAITAYVIPSKGLSNSFLIGYDSEWLHGY